jgi:hypothetical protein
MKSGLFVSILGALLVAVGSAGAATEPDGIDVHQAISIGDSAVKAQVRTSSALEVVTVKRFSRPLNDLIPKKPADPYRNDLYEKLKNHTYWLVYYVTPSAEFGGDVGVFIDARSGAVIGVYQGK